MPLANFHSPNGAASRTLRDSLETLTGCKLEPSLKDDEPGSKCQFERLGYFCADSEEHTGEEAVINRIVTLRDSWAKIEKQAMASTN